MKRAIRYLVVGAIAFAIDLGLLLALVPVMPLIAATAIALAWNFAARALWIYRD